MNKTLLFALMIGCGLVVLGCGDNDENNNNSASGDTDTDTDTDTDSDSDGDSDSDTDSDGDCPAALHLQVGSVVCDFAAGEVECYYQVEQDDGLELEVVGCGGENDTCEFEFQIVTFDGEPVDGEIGLADESQGSETEGDLVPDGWEFEKTDGRLSLSFSGAMDDDSSIEVEGCIDDLKWTEGGLDEEEDEDSCVSENNDGHFYCEEITDEDACTYVAERCIDDGISEGDCCAWDPDAGNCGAAAEDLPCDLITDQAICDTIFEECDWETGSDGDADSDGDGDEGLPNGEICEGASIACDRIYVGFDDCGFVAAEGQGAFCDDCGGWSVDDEIDCFYDLHNEEFEGDEMGCDWVFEQCGETLEESSWYTG